MDEERTRYHNPGRKQWVPGDQSICCGPEIAGEGGQGSLARPLSCSPRKVLLLAGTNLKRVWFNHDQASRSTQTGGEQQQQPNTNRGRQPSRLLAVANTDEKPHAKNNLSTTAEILTEGRPVGRKQTKGWTKRRGGTRERRTAGHRHRALRPGGLLSPAPQPSSKE